MAWIIKSSGLSTSEMKNNADLFIIKCRSLGIADNTIAALLGNAQAESSVNPGRVEDGGGGGFGLFQWTPKTVLINNCSSLGLNYNDGDDQIECMYAECIGTAENPQWYSTSAFISQGNYFGGAGTDEMVGIKGSEFLKNTGNWSPEFLARLFMCAYERPAYDKDVNHWEKRVEFAKKWKTYIETGNFPEGGEGGGDSGEGGGTPTRERKKRYNFVLFARRKAGIRR